MLLRTEWWKWQEVLHTQLRGVLWKVFFTYHTYAQDDHVSNEVYMRSSPFSSLSLLVILLDSLGLVLVCHLFLLSPRDKSTLFHKQLLLLQWGPGRPICVVSTCKTYRVAWTILHSFEAQETVAGWGSWEDISA